MWIQGHNGNLGRDAIYKDDDIYYCFAWKCSGDPQSCTIWWGMYGDIRQSLFAWKGWIKQWSTRIQTGTIRELTREEKNDIWMFIITKPEVFIVKQTLCG